MMNDEDVIALIAEAIEVEPGALTPETRIDSVDEWNSIGWLTIMAMLDERIGLQIGAKTIRSFQTVADVQKYVAEHQSAT